MPAPNAATCLSVQQPWPAYIEAGAKTLEIRSWPTRHRGPLVICAGKRPFKGMADEAAGLPTGVAICVVDVVDCRPMQPADAAAAGVDYAPDLFAWVLANPRPVERVEIKGRLGLFPCQVPIRPLAA